MTIRVALHRVCDRCMRVFESRQMQYGEDVPVYERKAVLLTVGGTELVNLTDLCTECASVVEGLIQRLKMEPSDKKKRKDKEKPADPAKEETPPPEVVETVDRVPEVPSGAPEAAKDDLPF